MTNECDPCFLVQCQQPDFYRAYSLQGLPPQPLVPVIPPVKVCNVEQCATVSCGDTPSDCAEPFYETETFDDIITPDVAAPDRAGCFAVMIPVDLIAGAPVNLWMRSAIFDTYLILLDPSNNIVATNDGSGWNEDTDNDNSLLAYTPLVTGTYTVECTTFFTGVTGAFSLIVSSGAVVTQTTQNQNIWKSLYVPTTKLIFLVDQSCFTPKVVVVDALTLDIVKTWDFTIFTAGIPCLTDAEYSVTQDAVFVILLTTEKGQQIVEFTPDGLTLVARYDTTVSVGNSFTAYDSINDHLFVGSDGGVDYIIFDCATRTTISGANLSKVCRGAAYSPTGTQFYLVASAGNDISMDANTFVETGLAIHAGNLVIPYLASLDRWLIAYTNAVHLVNPADYSVTTIITQNINFQWGFENPTRNQLVVLSGLYGVILLNLDDFAPVNDLAVGALGRAYPGCLVPDTCRIFVSDFNTSNAPHAQVSYLMP